MTPRHAKKKEWGRGGRLLVPGQFLINLSIQYINGFFFLPEDDCSRQEQEEKKGGRRGKYSIVDCLLLVPAFFPFPSIFCCPGVDKLVLLSYILTMNETSELNQMIEQFEHFELDEKEYLVDIFSKELREEKRERIYLRYVESKENREKGNVKTGDIRDLRADIEED
jgi:hypothetical protein